jgi:hypothetical protein
MRSERAAETWRRLIPWGETPRVARAAGIRPDTLRAICTASRPVPPGKLLALCQATGASLVELAMADARVRHGIPDTIHLPVKRMAP